MTTTPLPPKLLAGPAAFLSTLAAMAWKELLIMLRYPVEFVASFGQIFLIVTSLTLAGLMFKPPAGAASGPGLDTAGIVVYGFVMFMFLGDTLWTIGYNVRRDQKQGTLEMLYLSPASKFANLLSRVVITLIWTGALCVMAAWLMSGLIGRLPAHNVPLAALLLVLALSGTFGTGFAFAAVTLRLKEAAQTLANLLQFGIMIFCAPFFPFSALPEALLWVARLLPPAHAIDAFRSTLMGYPAGFPELAPIEVEIVVVAAYGLLMPLIGYWLYRREENRARREGTLSEY